MSAAQKHSEEEGLSLLSARVGGLETRQDKLEMAINRLTDAVNSSRNTNWSLVIAIISTLAVFLGGAWALIRLQTENAISPVIAEQGVSKTERHSNQMASEKNSDRIRAVESSVAQIVMALSKIEIQHLAITNTQSSQTAEIYRMFSPVWSKVMGVPMPEGPFFFPQIATPKHLDPK